MSTRNDPFDETAAGYEAWYQTIPGSRADALEKAALNRRLQYFLDATTVLEVGAGTGHFTRWLNTQGLYAVGLDVSSAMLKKAQSLDLVPYVRGDAHRLPFQQNAFDLVAFITTLEFLERDRHALAEALRIADRGLVLGVLNRWSPLGLQRQIEGWFRPTIYDAAHFYTVCELRHLLQALGTALHIDREAEINWHTTLFPPWWPCKSEGQPWGGFIAMALSFNPKRMKKPTKKE